MSEMTSETCYICDAPGARSRGCTAIPMCDRCIAECREFNLTRPSTDENRCEDVERCEEITCTTYPDAR
jgi:hypothetical protein